LISGTVLKKHGKTIDFSRTCLFGINGQEKNTMKKADITPLGALSLAFSGGICAASILASVSIIIGNLC